MRCLEKVEGGKLVCLEVSAKEGRSETVRITGDFFLHPEESIERIEKSLEDVPLDIAEKDAERRISDALEGSVLIGATAADLARIFKKAVS